LDGVVGLNNVFLFFGRPLLALATGKIDTQPLGVK